MVVTPLVPRHRGTLVVACLTALISVSSACGISRGRIPDAETAIARAFTVSVLTGPRTVVEARAETFRELSSSPKIDPEKANRPAWLVILVGEHPSCDVNETCPSVPTREEITLDRDTGEQLGVVIRSAFAEPAGNDVPCPPDQCPPE